jgi:arylsulfatase A-like enzyme
MGPFRQWPTGSWLSTSTASSALQVPRTRLITSLRSGRRRYKGKFGDALRERSFARQKELGVIPADAELTTWPEEIPAWDDNARRSQASARPPDGGLRRLPGAHRPSRRPADRLTRRPGILHDTLIYYIIGDNGASAEGTPNGCFNELIVLNGAAGLETVEFMTSADRRLRHTGRVEPPLGRLGARDGHPLPVDQADRIALGRHPQRDDCALAERLLRAERNPSQFHQVIDVAPTVLEAAGLPEPVSLSGVQRPVAGRFNGLFVLRRRS